MDLFKIIGSIVINNTEANDQIDETADHAEQSEGKISKAFKKVAMAVAAAFAIDKIKDWVVEIGKASVMAYADYEQLTGGIKKLYGDAWEDVVANAQNAWKTVGMSTNDYMQNATAFSAALVNSLSGNTKEAARIADMAMQDIADNANTFGKYSVQELTEVYQSLAKGNYQMLDNLNLGFGGTKAGLQQLLDKAEEFSGVKYDINSYADIVQAIHEVQEQMGITGTTALEAAGTIQGSIEMTKAAWQNLLLGVADETQEIGPLFENVFNSALTAASNIIPRIGQAIMGFGELFGMVAQKLVDGVPKLFESLPIVETFSQKVLAKSSGVVKSGMDLLLKFVQGVMNGLPTFIQTVPHIIGNFADVINTNAPTVISGGVKIIGALIKGIIAAVPTLVANIPSIISAMVKVFLAYNWLSVGKTLITNVGNGIKSAGSNLLAKVKDIVSKIKSFFSFKVSPPHIPVPAFAISPGGWKIGDLLKGTIPKLSVKWHAEGGIFDKPTIFETAKGLHGVGEAGAEAITPISKLQDYVSEAIDDRNGQLLQAVDRLIDATEALLDGMPAAIDTALENKKIKWNDRELGRLVRTYA